jgi:hypothetical protein
MSHERNADSEMKQIEFPATLLRETLLSSPLQNCGTMLSPVSLKAT